MVHYKQKLTMDTPLTAYSTLIVDELVILKLNVFKNFFMEISKLIRILRMFF